jgi:hypothetical protein
MCWNLDVEAVPYLRRLEAFCRKNDLNPDRVWYGRAIGALAA